MSETTPLSVFEPAGEAKGGLVVIQEIFGVNDHIEDVCRRLAEEGWLAVAPHLFHRSGDPKLGYDAMEEGRSHAQELTADGVMEDVDAAVARIAEAGIPPSRTGIVGFCMGGSVALVTAARRDLGAAVTFYGGGVTEGRFGFGALVDEAPALRARGSGCTATSTPRFRSPASRSCASPPPSPASRPRSSAIPTPATASTATSGRATTSRRRPTPGVGWASGSTTTFVDGLARRRQLTRTRYRREFGSGSRDLHLRFRFVSYVRTQGGTSTDGGHP